VNNKDKYSLLVTRIFKQKRNNKKSSLIFKFDKLEKIYF